MSLLKALLDGIIGEDERLAGRRFTRLTAQLADTETATATVETTVGFGEWEDGANDALLLVGGELVYATGRTGTTFTTLTRGYGDTDAQTHPPATLVYDYSQNVSALDLVRRGFLVDYAIGDDLNVIGRNLGLTRCTGLTDDQYREIIKALAYGYKSTTQAFEAVLDILWGAGNYEILESPAEPWMVKVNVVVSLATSLDGRFFLNSGELQDTTGLNTVDVTYDVLSPTLGTYAGSAAQTIAGRAMTYPAGALGTAICGVYDDTEAARRGFREGLTNYFLPGGSVLGNTITLGTSPGAAGTPVIVDYTAFSAHYLAENETTLDASDQYAYLADPLLATRCLLEQVRAAGVQVEVGVTT